MVMELLRIKTFSKFLPSREKIEIIALYYTVRLTVEIPALPDIQELAAYRKLSEEQRSCNQDNWLDLVAENKDEIREIISAFN